MTMLSHHHDALIQVLDDFFNINDQDFDLAEILSEKTINELSMLQLKLINQPMAFNRADHCYDCGELTLNCDCPADDEPDTELIDLFDDGNLTEITDNI